MHAIEHKKYGPWASCFFKLYDLKICMTMVKLRKINL